jgi:hypothetical protein
MESEKKCLVILGAQWGDEGKGKIVDMLAADVDIVGRCGGGSNAGSYRVIVQSLFMRFQTRLTRPRLLRSFPKLALKLRLKRLA